jgi:hypothetical protein
MIAFWVVMEARLGMWQVCPAFPACPGGRLDSFKVDTTSGPSSNLLLYYHTQTCSLTGCAVTGCFAGAWPKRAKISLFSVQGVCHHRGPNMLLLIRLSNHFLTPLSQTYLGVAQKCSGASAPRYYYFICRLWLDYVGRADNISLFPTSQPLLLLTFTKTHYSITSSI